MPSIKKSFNADSRKLHTDFRRLSLQKNLRKSALDSRKSAFKMYLAIIKKALIEDCYRDDITTKSLNYGDLKLKAVIIAKENGVCAGINLAKEVFKTIDKKIRFNESIKDGKGFKKGDILAKIEGSVKNILAGERVALNFLSYLSGVATFTNQFVSKTKPYKAKILDTRKTTPTLRYLEKYAVQMGGGFNHRMHLAEGVLIKDNHFAALCKKYKKLNLSQVLKKVIAKNKGKKVEIEVENFAEFKEVLKCKPDFIMLDNMSVKEIKQCVQLRNKTNKKTELEVSGNVNLANVKKLASLGADRISIGSLTHSPKAIDFSLEFV